MAIVEGVYRLLGAIAPVNQRLGRHRVNLIPANFLLLFGVGTLAIISFNSVVKVLASRRAPEPQTVDTLISSTRFAQGYVAVQGRLMAESRLSFEKEASPRAALADYTWAPLMDAATGRAMLVQFDAQHPFPPNGADVTVEGILRPVNSFVAQRVKQTKYVQAGIPIHRGLMLVAGRKPGSLDGPLMTGTIFGLAAVALLWLIFNRNVVFMPGEAAMSSGRVALLDAPAGDSLVVSATLTLDAKTRRFFTNMPAVVQRTESGDTALVSAIVTSSTYFGIKTSEHSGVWMVLMRPGSITEAQTGHVFWGLKKMAATRFRYVNAMTGASEQAVVAAAAGSAAPQYV